MEKTGRDRWKSVGVYVEKTGKSVGVKVEKSVRDNGRGALGSPGGSINREAKAGEKM